MGQPYKARAASAETGAVLQQYTHKLPGLMKVINSIIGPNELAKLSSAQATTGGYDKLLADSNDYASTRAATTDAHLLDTVGRQKAATATDIDKGINPEFYSAKAAGLDSILGQLKMLSLDKANPEAERLVNLENTRSGNIGNPTEGTNTVKNALQFGDERLKRSAALTGALNTANNFLTTSRATFNPFGVSMSTPSSTSSGSTFGAVGSGVQGTSNNLLGNMFGTANNQANLRAGQRDSLDRANETMSSL